MEIIFGLLALYGGVLIFSHLVAFGAVALAFAIAVGGIVFALAVKLLIFVLRLIAKARGADALKRFESRRAKVLNFFDCDSEFAVILCLFIMAAIVGFVVMVLLWVYKLFGGTGVVLAGLLVFNVAREFWG